MPGERVAYVGVGEAANPHAVFVEVGALSEPLRHVVKHSPTGFSWGYGGSGPAELARCILLDALERLGAPVKCAACRGTGRRDDEGSCWECDGGYRLRPGAYQDFKRDVVMRWPHTEGWQLELREVRDWISEHGGPDALLLEAVDV